MGDSFRDRLKRLHGAHQRGRDGADGPSGVYRACDVDVDQDDPEDLQEARPRLGGWEGLGGEQNRNYSKPIWVIENRFQPEMSHGKRTLKDMRGVDHQLLADMSDRLPPTLGPGEILYMDTETTGLGADAYPFMIGVGFWDGTTLVVQHLVIDEADQEPALLEAFQDLLDQFYVLGTFNGLSYDVPLLKRRLEAHGIEERIDAKRHLDLLPLARRLFPGLNRYRLANLEKKLLEFEREGDVPSSQIPTLWGKFRRSQNPEMMRGVVLHNRLDILSMAGLVASAVEGDDIDLAPKVEPSKLWPMPTLSPEITHGVADKLARSYKLRGRFAGKKETPQQVEAETAPAGPLEGQDPLSQRMGDLQVAAKALIDQQMWREAFPMLCEVVALAPHDEWGLEQLARCYRALQREDLAARIEMRRS